METPRPLAVFKTLFLSLGLICGLAACTHSTSRPPDIPVLGAHENRGSAEYVGTPLVTGKKSIQELYAEYPKQEPDENLSKRLLEILSDKGRSLYWSAKESLEYCQNGSTKIPAWVRVPPQCEDRACPVIVFFHGGCSGPGYHWRPEFFLRAGFIFIDPNIRGTSCYGKTWEDADNGPKRVDAITDVKAWGDCAKKRFSRDGQAPQVGALGWSYGGYAALMGMTRFAGTFDAGYALAAKVDLYSYFKNTSPARRKKREGEYGDPDSEPELFKKLSPITYLDKVKSPIALMLGGRDPKVSLSDADHFVTVLKQRGQDVKLMIVPEHGHLTERPEEIVFEHAHVLQFFSQKFNYPLKIR